MKNTLSPLILVTAFWSYLALGQKCHPVDFGNGSVVCKCNATYCDFYPDPEPPKKGKYISYITSKSGKRLERNDGVISSVAKDNYIIVKIDAKKKYQTIQGFGASFTDSAGINIKSLSLNTQENFMRSHFSSNGSKYSLARVPIGGTDFSIRGYTYDDVDGDMTLSNFSLAIEDTKYKIPLMQEALKLNPELRFVSAAWTAPPWMKTNKTYIAISWLENKYYQTYANYIVKFLEAYKNKGLEIWSVSTGNEPFTSLNLANNIINSMFWSPENVAKWITNNLGPGIRNSSSNETCILLLDDLRVYLPWYVNDVKRANKAALDYAKGIAVHWYFDDFSPASILDSTHNEHPDKFILMTETSLGFLPSDSGQRVILGSWSRAESLIQKMFQNLNHWVAGWIDWNLALNTEGGPSWTNNNLDASIIVDAKNDLFYKQPYYYVITHFSKFVPRNAVRIHVENRNDDILTLAFKTEDDQKVVLLYNTDSVAKNVSVVDVSGYINFELPEYSLHTILYKD